jgi:CRP-like cAMP-binding protein
VLSADEQTLYDLAFRALRPREFLSLTLVGEWRDAAAGQKLLTEGQPAAEICISIAGNVEVSRHGEPVGTLAPGQLVGTGLVLTGSPSPVEASFTGSARYFAWPTNSIRSFLDTNPQLRTTLLRLANRDLAEKLERLMSVL